MHNEYEIKSYEKTNKQQPHYCDLQNTDYENKMK